MYMLKDHGITGNQGTAIPLTRTVTSEIVVRLH